jgi:hypothetical protein
MLTANAIVGMFYRRLKPSEGRPEAAKKRAVETLVPVPGTGCGCMLYGTVRHTYASTDALAYKHKYSKGD